MKLMQRLGSEPDENYVNQYIDVIKKYPGSCDNVWLATKYGFPKLETHLEVAEYLSSVADKFRSAGVSVSLQLSNSIGHGEYISRRDCSGLVFESSPARKMVGHDGTVANYCFCWRGEFFREYTVKEITYYAEKIKPDCIWIDDDFRARNHAPVNFGCFCDDCIKEFNLLHRASFTRETLVEEILHGDILWRERYIDFMKKGLYDFMFEIGSAVHSVSPDTTLGLQHGPYGAYTGFGYDFIFKAMLDSTGHKPASRPGAAGYNDHDPNEFLIKGVDINWQNATLPDFVECKCPEIESLPYCAYGKSPAGTAFETSYYFANGNTDMSYAMMMNLNEPVSWHEKEFKLFQEHRVYWDKLAEVNKHSYQSGLQFYISKDTWKKELSENEDLFELADEHYNEAYLFTRDAIPIAYDKKDDSLMLLHPECAKALSVKDIKYLLTKNVVTDGETIKILTDKGVDFGIQAYKLEGENLNRVRVKANKNPINGELENWISNGFVAGRFENYYLEKNGAECEVLSYYENTLPLKVYSDDKEYPYGISDVILKTPKGAKWAVFGYTLWKGIMNFARHEQILNAADYISDNSLAVRVKTPFQVSILPRKDEEGKTVCVSLTNCTVGNSGEIELLIREPKGENFTFMSQYDGKGQLTAEKCKEGFVLKIPNISPWSVFTIFVD